MKISQVSGTSFGKLYIENNWNNIKFLKAFDEDMERQKLLSDALHKIDKMSGNADVYLQANKENEYRYGAGRDASYSHNIEITDKTGEIYASCDIDTYDSGSKKEAITRSMKSRLSILVDEFSQYNLPDSNSFIGKTLDEYR